MHSCSAAGVVFAVDPAIDLQVFAKLLGWAERHRDGLSFRLLMLARQTGPVVIVAAVAPAVITLVMAVMRPRSRWMMIPLSAALFTVLTLALGPGLLVNTGLKEHWVPSAPGRSDRVRRQS